MTLKNVYLRPAPLVNKVYMGIASRGKSNPDSEIDITEGFAAAVIGWLNAFGGNSAYVYDEQGTEYKITLEETKI